MMFSTVGFACLRSCSVGINSFWLFGLVVFYGGKKPFWIVRLIKSFNRHHTRLKSIHVIMSRNISSLKVFSLKFTSFQSKMVRKVFYWVTRTISTQTGCGRNGLSQKNTTCRPLCCLRFFSIIHRYPCLSVILQIFPPVRLA